MIKRVKYVVKIRFCKTAMITILDSAFFSLIASFYPYYYPTFIFALILMIITILPAIYIEGAEGEINYEC